MTTTTTIPVEGWAMTATDTHWHYWRGDTTVCGLTRTADWSLGLVRAGDCPACTDQLRHDLTEEEEPPMTRNKKKDRALVGEALS